MTGGLLQLPNVFRITLISFAIFIGGCAQFGSSSHIGEYSAFESESTLIASSYKAADALLGGPTSRTGDGSQPKRILVSTVVNLNQLNQTSPLGRLISEQVGVRFVQNGAAVNEIKLRGNLYVRNNEGEFLLSRELKEISAAQDADLLLVGTYTEGSDSVYVSLRLVSALDGRVVTGYNYALIKNSNIRSLLTQARQGN